MMLERDDDDDEDGNNNAENAAVVNGDGDGKIEIQAFANKIIFQRKTTLLNFKEKEMKTNIAG